MCFQKKGEMNESCFYNDQCLELNPGHVKARYRKAVIHAHEKEFDQALETIRQLIEQEPESQEFQTLMREIE